ncbi:MAG: 50S ribosomal protein L13 [Candidatus Magasanikbacteria bacterium]|nr:50S ribosomal protein L13 [Candidatus Magasanikbacteria bacterium]
MNTPIQRNTIEIDASGIAPGRAASQAARALQGKNKASYESNRDGGDFVIIKNAAKVLFTGKKLAQKDYLHHTSHPGGLKRTPLKKIFLSNPAEVLKRAIYGMLPKNKLRDHMMKRLTIK